MPPSPEARDAPPAHAPARPPLPLRSTAASKEVVYDLDSDSLSDSDALAMSSTHMVPDESAWSWATAHAAPSRTSLDALSERVRSLSSALGDPDQLPEWLRRGAGVFEGTVNMANSILGAGIVGLPYSMRESGFVAGVVLLLGIALLTDWTIRLIVLNAKLSGRSTYIDIMEHCFGHHGKRTSAPARSPTQSPSRCSSLCSRSAACAPSASWSATRSPTCSRASCPRSATRS